MTGSKGFGQHSSGSLVGRKNARIAIYAVIVTSLLAIMSITLKLDRIQQQVPLQEQDQERPVMVPTQCHGRREQLTQQCAHLGKSNRPTEFDFLLCDERHKVMYCPIGKVGCTTFKTLMVEAIGQLKSNFNMFNVHSQETLKMAGIRRLSSFPQKYITEHLNTYRKFMVVRHPFDRLVSAYTNKLAGGRKYNFAHKYYSLFRRVFPESCSNMTRPTITFKQFLHLLTDHHSEFDNHHWGLYWRRCHPCSVHYDSIVKLETMETDMKLILDFFNMTNTNVTIGNVSRKMGAEHKLRQVDKVFKNIDPEVIQKLKKMYSKDFELFGYGFDNGRATC